MKVLVPVFLTALATTLGGSLWYLHVGNLPTWVEPVRLPLLSTLFGGLGAVAYCLRAVYLNRGVHRRWDPDWLPWYFIRPVIGLIFGGISFAILKAGLLLLDAQQPPDGTSYGFVALAFIAGFNVDRFVRRMEEAAKATFGIEPSRTSQAKDADR